MLSGSLIGPIRQAAVWLINPSPPPPSSHRGLRPGRPPWLYLVWGSKSEFCGAPHYIWTRGLISYSPSITLTFTSSPSPPAITHTPLSFCPSFFLCVYRTPGWRGEAPVHGPLDATSPDRRGGTHWTHWPVEPLWGVWDFKYSLSTRCRPGRGPRRARSSGDAQHSPI